MKVTRLNEDKKFEPIKIEITIETEHEFVDLYYRLNTHEDNVDCAGNYFKSGLKANNSSYSIFSLLYDIAKERGLKK